MLFFEQALECMLYTLDWLNNRTDFLPGIKLGAYVLDDCDRDTYGLEQSIDFIKGKHFCPIFVIWFVFALFLRSLHFWQSIVEQYPMYLRCEECALDIPTKSSAKNVCAADNCRLWLACFVSKWIWRRTRKAMQSHVAFRFSFHQSHRTHNIEHNYSCWAAFERILACSVNLDIDH